MPITLSSPTFTTVHNSQSFLIGNSGHIFDFSGTIKTTVGLTSTSNLSVMVSGANELTLTGGNWAEFGILEGNSIDLDAVNAGANVDATVTVTDVNNNILTHNGDLTDFLFTMFPSPDFGQLIVKNNTHTDIDVLDVFFNLVDNEVDGTEQSLIDSEVNQIRFSGVGAMVATDVVNGVILGNKSGGAIISSTLTKDDANEYTLDIKFANWVDYTDLNPDIVPSPYLANSSIKPFFKLQGKVVASNPNSTITSIESSQLGNVGFVDENYNQGINDFLPFFIEFKNTDGQIIDEIDHTAVTDVEIQIARIGATTINENKFITKIQHLPSSENYKNNANSYLENTYQSILERDTVYVKTAYGVNGAQLVISDEVTTVGTTTIDGDAAQLLNIKFKLTPNTAFTNYFSSLNESERVYRLVTTVQSTGLKDDVTLVNKLGGFAVAPLLGGIAEEVKEWNFFNHYQDGDEAQGTEYNTLTEDDTLTTAVLRLNKADNYESLAFKIKVIDVNGNSFDLFSRVIPMNNYPINGDNVRLLNLTENLDYLLPSIDRNTFELVIGTIASTTYDINFKHTFLNSWRYWLAQANALNTFLDPLLPNNGLNNEWVRYTDGGTIQYAIELVKNGVTFTAQQDIQILDYDVSPDVTSTIYLEDTSGNSLPSILDGEDVVVIADHESTESWSVENTWGWIAYRPKESEKRKLLSSKWDDNGNNLPLRPLSGETKAQLTFPTPTVARLKALVKGSEIANEYTFISRINSPNTAPILDYFIFDVRTINAGTSSLGQFTLPLLNGFTYDFQIEWGDGSVEYYAGVAGTDIPNDITHSYPPALLMPRDFTFRIKIGVTDNVGFPTIFFFGGGDRLKLIQTVTFGDVGWTRLNSSFDGCENNSFAVGCTGNFDGVNDFNACWSNNQLDEFPSDLAELVNHGTTYVATWQDNNLETFPAVAFPNATGFSACWENNKLTSFPNVINFAPNVLSLINAWKNNELASFPTLDLSNATNIDGAFLLNNLTNFPIINFPNATLARNTWAYNNLSAFPDINLSSAEKMSGTWRNNGVIDSFDCRNFNAIDDGVACFEETTLPTADWSDILVSQNANNLNDSVTLHGGNSKYNVDGGIARTNLVDVKLWTIIDGGAE